MAESTVNWTNDSQQNHEIVYRFEKAFGEGKNPQVSDFLQGEGASRQQLLVELLHSDLELRIRAGQSHRMQDHLKAFPELAQQPDEVASLLKTEIRCLRQMGIQPMLQKYQAEYGSILGKRIEELFAQESRGSREAKIGSVIAGKYKLLAELGEGGMGSVYAAEQTQPVRRIVAIKLIKPGMDSSGVLARFEAERQALAMMDHPNIARMLDGGITEDGQPYFVMEQVKGLPITKFCDQEKLSLDDRIELFMAVCQGVQHAHQKGIIHRDLKPSNILVTLVDGKPVPKVIDFGVAKALHQKLTDKTVYTEAGRMVGTLEYMAPEQADLNNLDVDTRADVYALGVVLYELLTGQVPFTGKELRSAAYDEMLRMIREMEPPRPSTKLSSSFDLPKVAAQRQVDPKQLTSVVAGELDWIVMKCLEKERGRRYETANALSRELGRYLVDEPIEARPPSVGYRLRKFVRRNRAKAIVASLLIISLVSGITGTTFGWISADEARNDEVKERIRADKLADEAQLSREKALEASKASSLQARIAQQKAKEVSRLLGIGRLNEGFSAARDHDYYASLLQFADQKSHFADDNEAITTINHRLSAHWRFGNRPSLSSVILQPRSSNEVRINYSNIYSADLSPDGLRVVTVGNTGPARIWDTDSGIELIPPISHAAPISKTIFTNDGNRLVTTALDGTICVWNSRNGKAITPIMKHGESAVIDAALCPDGTRIVTGSEDHTAQVWNALTGEPIGPRIKHSSIVDHVQYSSNGRFLVTVTGASVRGKSEQSFRKIADMVMIDKTKHFLAMIIDWLPFHSAISSHHCHAISNILYIYTFLTSLTDNHTPSASVTVWDSSRQSSLFRTELPMIITDVRFSNDSSRLLVATLDGNVYLYDLHDRGKVLHVLSNPLQNSPPWQEQRLVLAQFVVSGKMVITANAEGDFRIWDTETGGLFHAFTGRRESVLHAECSHDTRYILATYSDGVVCIYNVLNGLEITSIKCRDSLNQASFSLDDRRIITRSSELIRVWDLSTCRQRPLILEQTAQSGIRFISTGQLFWRNGSAAGLVEIPTRKANAINISSLRDSDSVEVCDTGEIAIVFGKDKIATVWTIRSVPQKLFDLSHPDFVRSATFSHDGTYVATVCLDESVRIWDCRSGKQVGLPIKENMQVRRIAFSNSSHKIAVTTSSDNSNNSNYVQVQLWDAETAKTISNKKYIYDMVSYPGFSNDLGRLIERTADRINIISTISDVSSTTLPDTSMHSGAFLSPDGRFVATTNGGKILRVMESDTGRSLFHPLMNEAWIQYAVFTKDSRYLLTRDANSSLRVWETSLGKAVSPSLTHPASLSEAIVSDTGLYIVARKGDPSGTLYLWDLSLSDFLRDDLLVLSQVYAGAKLDSIGTPSAIQGDILVKAYRELSLKHRSEFKVDHKLALTWRQEEIKICLNEGNISAAFFHQNWLLAEAVLEATKSNAK